MKTIVLLISISAGLAVATTSASARITANGKADVTTATSQTARSITLPSGAHIVLR